jgi:hypothetical protein
VDPACYSLELWPLAQKLLVCPVCNGDGNRHATHCAQTKHRPELERKLIDGLRDHEIETLRDFRVLAERTEDEQPHFLLECTMRRCPVFFWLRKPALSPFVAYFVSGTIYRGKVVEDGRQTIAHRAAGLAPGDWVRIENHRFEHRRDT